MNEINQFMEFLDAAPSSFHAAHRVAEQLVASGFHKHEEDQPWDASPGGHVIVRDGAMRERTPVSELSVRILILQDSL